MKALVAKSLGRRRVATAVALVTFLFFQPGTAHAGPRRDLRILRAREAALQRGLDRTLHDRSHALDALRLSEDRVAHAGRALIQARRREYRALAAMRRLQAQEATLRLAEGRERVQIARQAVAAYEAGRAGPVQLFFAQQSPQLLSRMMTYYGYILRSRARRLRVARRTVGAMLKTASAIGAESQTLRDLAQTRAHKEQLLEAALARRARAVKILSLRARTGHARLLALRERAHRLQVLLEGLRRLPKVPAGIPHLSGPFADFRGRLPLPIPAPFSALRTSASGGLSRWSGVVIPGHPGEEVRAVFPGRVVYANWLRGYGLLLILENGDGYMTLYGHNQTLLEHVGDFVHGGQVIATVGDSGGFSRPGLYFDLSHNGQPLNPLVWLAH